MLVGLTSPAPFASSLGSWRGGGLQNRTTLPPFWETDPSGRGLSQCLQGMVGSPVR